MDQFTSILEERAPVLASIAVVLVAVFAANVLFKNDYLSQIPLIGSEVGDAEKRRKAYITNGLDFYKKGYELFKSKAYRLTALDGMAKRFFYGRYRNTDGMLMLPLFRRSHRFTSAPFGGSETASGRCYQHRQGFRRSMFNRWLKTVLAI